MVYGHTQDHYGYVKFYNEQKAWGFVVRDDGQEYFMHRAGIKCDDVKLKPETQVVFNIVDTPRGPQAVDVELMLDEEECK